jgi:hypothetical protein
MTPIFSRKAVLWLWDTKQSTFQTPTMVKAEISKQPGYRYWLFASTDEGTLLGHEISSAMNHQFSTSELAVTWNHTGRDGNINNWCISFKSGQPEQGARDREVYSAFLEAFAQALWESVNHSPWDKMKVYSHPFEEISLMPNFTNSTERGEGLYA